LRSSVARAPPQPLNGITLHRCTIMTFLYCELNDGADEVANNLLTGLLRLRHSCNPDFADKYSRVVRWYVEIDTTKARVLREIGLDESGEPIVFGPFGRNDGLWTGVSTSIPIDGRDAPPVQKRRFDAAWASLEDAFRDRIPPKRIEPRIPITKMEQLVGRWSACILCGPGSMSDQLISFPPSGKGYFEDYNGVLMYYDEFDWEVVGSGRITIRGAACYYLDDNGQVVETPSDFENFNVAAESQVHYSGSGASIEVLYLPLGNERRQWVAQAYGRCAVSLAEIDRPTFT
jgi:hypothetical protein